MNIREYLINRMEKTAGQEIRHIVNKMREGGYKKRVVAKLMRKNRKEAFRKGTAKTTMPEDDFAPGPITKRNFGLTIQNRGRLETPGTLRQMATVSKDASPYRKKLSRMYFKND